MNARACRWFISTASTQPGWIEPAPDAWKATVTRLVAGECWILDGNFGGTLEQRLAACDTVVFLDMPRLQCVWRVVRHRGRART